MVRASKGLAVVTGGSSGIGLELCRLLAADGHPLVLVARDVARLQQTAAELEAAHSVEVEIISSDLGIQGGTERVLEVLGERVGQIEVLINNAGFGVYGPFVQTPLERELEMLEVNVRALTLLTKKVLPGMVARGSGRVLNVASTAAFQPGPLMAVYYASKAYVLSFSEALNNELSGTGVAVTALCPGPVLTRFQATARMEESKLMRQKAMVLDASEVAQAGYRAMRKGAPLVVPGAANKFLVQGLRLMPRRAITGIVRRIQEK